MSYPPSRAVETFSVTRSPVLISRAEDPITLLWMTAENVCGEFGSVGSSGEVSALRGLL